MILGIIDYFLKVYKSILLICYIGIALVQYVAKTDGLANEFRELGHISKYADIELHVSSHRLRCKGEHFSECASCVVNTIEKALISVWEIAAVNTCVKRA
jgi:hypothetical protein